MISCFRSAFRDPGELRTTCPKMCSIFVATFILAKSDISSSPSARASWCPPRFSRGI